MTSELDDAITTRSPDRFHPSVLPDVFIIWRGEVGEKRWKCRARNYTFVSVTREVVRGSCIRRRVEAILHREHRPAYPILVDELAARGPRR